MGVLREDVLIGLVDGILKDVTLKGVLKGDLSQRERGILSHFRTRLR